MGSDKVKLITLPDGNSVLNSSGTVTPNAKAVLLTDADGNPVIHQSGSPAAGSKALMGTNKDGNRVILFSGGTLPIIYASRMWSDLKGSKIYYSLFSPAGYIFEMDIVSWNGRNSSPALWWHAIGGIRYDKQLWATSEGYSHNYREYRVVKVYDHPSNDKYADVYYEINPFWWGSYVVPYYNESHLKLLSTYSAITPSFLKYADVIPGHDMRRTTNQGALFHDRFGNFFCAGNYPDTPCECYIQSEIPDVINYEGDPVTIEPLDSDELQLFPSAGVFITKHNQGPDMYNPDGVPFYVNIRGFYLSRSGSSLNDVHMFNAECTVRLSLGSPISITHTFVKDYEEMRATHFEYEQRPGDQYGHGRARISRFKVEETIPDEGKFLLIYKHNGMYGEIAIREYFLDDDGWIKFYNIRVREIIPASDYGVDLGTGGIYFRYASVYPYLYESKGSVFFLGHYFYGVNGTFEEEIDEEWEEQLYIRLIEGYDNSSTSCGVRFYHDDLYSGVQTNLYPSVDKISEIAYIPNGNEIEIWRVESIKGATFILSTGRKNVYQRELRVVKLPNLFYSSALVKCSRFEVIENELVSPPSGYYYLDITSLGNVVFAYCMSKTSDGFPAIFYSAGGGWTLLREIKPVPSPTDITNKIRTYSNQSCSFSAINGECAFFLIPEQRFITQGAYPYHIYVSSYYALYRISRTFEVHKYAFSAPGYPSDPIGVSENENLIRTPMPKPAIQMICYDIMDPMPPFEDSDFPGITYVAIRHLENYGDTISNNYSTNEIPLIRFEIPHAMMDIVP